VFIKKLGSLQPADINRLCLLTGAYGCEKTFHVKENIWERFINSIRDIKGESSRGKVEKNKLLGFFIHIVS